MTADTTHQCPAPDCSQRVPFERLTCRWHWSVISLVTRSRLVRLWREDPGSTRYFDARARALLAAGVGVGVGVGVPPDEARVTEAARALVTGRYAPTCVGMGIQERWTALYDALAGRPAEPAASVAETMKGQLP